ncbi:MAG: peptidoglycan recognition protein family protein [Planctomycetota bacterium]|nr:peptidoglycan recognition protein family protein [Planctomycetota bacterium]
MARHTPILIFVAALVTLTSCQQQAVKTVSLPEIMLDGPRFPQPPVVAIAPTTAPSLQVVVTLPPPAAEPAPEPTVPTGWLPPVAPRPWEWIVIHHSATNFGSAKIIDAWHRDKGWDELGYHFVVGNGTNTADGEIEVGPRWPKQKWGAHTKTADNRFNDFGIGICLVGNFDVDQPSESQLHAVAGLVAYLMKTYHIPEDHVIGHGQAKPTDCPGRYLSVLEVRAMAHKMLLANGDRQETGNARLAVAQSASDGLLNK